jgi:hypothetical protein
MLHNLTRMHVRQRIASATLALTMVAALALPLGAGAMSVPAADTSSMSIEQIESLITKLQRQLEEMRKGAKCFVGDKDLSLGDGEGDDGLTPSVRRLQEFLREKSHLKVKSTGYFGKLTRTAVVSFQASAGISQTGEFDAATRAKAHAMTCSKSLAATTAAKEKEAKKAEAEAKAAGVVRSIALKGDGRVVTWSVDGVSAQGFKVVWSKSPSPSYPNRESDRYQYFDSSSASQAKLEAFAGEGTYYVRVCEYLGGSCGAYSNEVKVQL